MFVLEVEMYKFVKRKRIRGWKKNRTSKKMRSHRVFLKKEGELRIKNLNAAAMKVQSLENYHPCFGNMRHRI